tara:strand:+ start:1212 stop:2714 length:1503 start_codon:yes stop_codon:yes gene_type:complete
MKKIYKFLIISLLSTVCAFADNELEEASSYEASAKRLIAFSQALLKGDTEAARDIVVRGLGEGYDGVDLSLLDDALVNDMSSLKRSAFIALISASKFHADNADLLAASKALLNDSSLEKAMSLDRALLEAVNAHNLAFVEMLLEDPRVNPNFQDEEGFSPLSKAAFQGYKDIVELLLKNSRVEPNAQNEDGETPLHFAVILEEGKDALDVLLGDLRVDPNIKNKKGETPLGKAVHFANTSAIELLLCDDRVDARLNNESGDSVFHLAAKYHFGYSVYSPRIDKTAERPFACSFYASNPNVKNNEGNTAFHVAAILGYEGNAAFVIELLKDPRVDPNIQNSAGNTALHVLCSNDDNDSLSKNFIKALVEDPRLDPNIKNKDGDTALHLAIKHGNEHCAKVLMKNPRLDPDIQDLEGSTALHLAAKHGHEGLILFLLHDSRVSPDIENNDGVTALQTVLPLYYKYDTIAQLLLNGLVALSASSELLTMTNIGMPIPKKESMD